jgi:hypothetical protein
MTPQPYVCCVHELQLAVEEHAASAPPDMITANTIRMCTGRSGTGSDRRIIPSITPGDSAAVVTALASASASIETWCSITV